MTDAKISNQHSRLVFLPRPASRLRGDIGDEVRVEDDDSANSAKYARHVVEDPAGWNHTKGDSEEISGGLLKKRPAKCGRYIQG